MFCISIRSLAVGALFVALASCARSELTSRADTLVLAPQFGSSASKVGAFFQNDELGVYAVYEVRALEATGNVLDNRCFFAATDGATFTTYPAAHYPSVTDVMGVYVYFPYQSEVYDAHAVPFSIETDQSTSEAAHRSDLCWGATHTTPRVDAVPIQLAHVLAKITVSLATSGPTLARITMPNALVGGLLDVETGAFTLGTESLTVSTSLPELIVPPQEIPRLIVETSDGERYTFEPPVPISLVAGNCTAISLTLNASSHTAQLAAPIEVAEWTDDSSLSSDVSRSVSNFFTLHWLMPHPDFTSIDSAAIVSVGREGVERSYPASQVVCVEGDNLYACFTMNFAVASHALQYSFPISSLRFYSNGRLVQECAATSLVGAWIYKQGNYTLGIYQQNLLQVVEGRITRWEDMGISGAISGGVNNAFVLEMLEPTLLDYRDVSGLRLTIDGTYYTWPLVELDPRSNYLLVRTIAVSFDQTVPLRLPSVYPFRIERVEVLDARGVSLMDYQCLVDVTRGGTVTLQGFDHRAILISTGVSAVTGWGSAGQSDAMVFHGPLASNPVRLVFSNGSGTALDAAQIRLTTAEGVCTLSSYTMQGTAYGAYSVGAVDFVSGTGPKPPRYPVHITSVEVLDDEGISLTAGPITATGLWLYQSGPLTIRVALP